MQTSVHNCEAEDFDASGSAVPHTEQLPPASRAPTRSRPKPSKFTIIQSADRVWWLHLNAAAISAETVERIKTILAQENRLSEESSSDRLAPAYPRHVPLRLNAEVLAETMARLRALLDEDERRQGGLRIEKPAVELDAPRSAVEQTPKDGALVPTTYQRGKRIATGSGRKALRSQRSPEAKATAANQTRKRPTEKPAGRPRKMIPWLDTIDGVYYVYWYDNTRKPARTKRRSTRTRDPMKAKQWYVWFLSEETSTVNVARTLTVSAALDAYYREHVEVKVVDKRRVSDAIGHLKVFFKGDLLKDVDIPASRAYADARRNGLYKGGRRRRVATAADSTIRRELVVLNAAANHAVRWKRITPAEKPSLDLPPEAGREKNWLTQAETREVLKTATGRLKDFLILLYFTGARRASIERLTRSQVDLKSNLINLSSPKETVIQRRSVKRRPIVPIFPEIRPTVERLMENYADSEYLFGDPNDMYRPFVNHLTKRGLADKAFPHVMRHSRATHLLQDGVPIYDVAKLLGDAVSTVERVYGHHSADYMVATIRQRGAEFKIEI